MKRSTQRAAIRGALIGLGIYSFIVDAEVRQFGITAIFALVVFAIAWWIADLIVNG